MSIQRFIFYFGEGVVSTLLAPCTFYIFPLSYGVNVLYYLRLKLSQVSNITSHPVIGQMVTLNKVSLLADYTKDL